MATMADECDADRGVGESGRLCGEESLDATLLLLTDLGQSLDDIPELQDWSF